MARGLHELISSPCKLELTSCAYMQRQAAGNRGKRQSVQASAALAGPVSATLSPSQIFATTLVSDTGHHIQDIGDWRKG